MSFLKTKYLGIFVIALLLLAGCEEESEEPQQQEEELVAKASASQTSADVGDEIILDASQSSGTTTETNYNWTIADKPSESQAQITDANAAMASFVADAAGNYTFQLSLTRGGDSDTDQVDVSVASAASTVTLDCENINEDMTLSDNGATPDYIVPCLIDINAAMTIEAGVTIQFKQDAGFVVNGNNGGSLSAIGTADDSIVMTGTQQVRGFWYGIYFYKSLNTDNKMDYCTIEYAGADDNQQANIRIGGSESMVAISNTTIRESAGYGIYIEDGASEVTSFANNTVTANVKPAYAEQHAMGMFEASSTYTGNDEDHIDVYTEINYPPANNLTVEAVDVPYRIQGSGLGLSTDMNIAPGATLEFTQNTRLIVYEEGSLSANGEEGLPITFTGVQKIRGYWMGIWYRSIDANNSLNYTVVEYAGGTDTYNSNVRIGGSGNGKVSISNSTLRESSGYAIYLMDEGSAFYSFSNNTITSNKDGALQIGQHAVGSLDSESTYSGNDQDIIRVEGAVNYPFENDQTWEALDVPYHVSASVGIKGDLTLSPGVTIEMGNSTRLKIYPEGSFYAVGQEGMPITITGAQKVAGSWEYIENQDSNSSKNQIEYCVIEYGGKNTAMYYSQYTDSRVAIRNSTFRNSQTNGIYIGDVGAGEPIYNSDIETANEFYNINGENVVLP